MIEDSFTRWELLLLRLMRLKEMAEFAVLKCRWGHRVLFGRGCWVSSKNFHYRGLGRLELGEGVHIDRGLHPVSFDMGAGAFARIGAESWIQCMAGPVRFTADKGATIEVGRRCWMTGGLVGAREKITIGDGVVIGWGAIILDSPLHDMDNDHPGRPDPVSIGKHVWIANSCTIMPGVTIGDHCVIGAGSLVTGDIPPNSFAAGRPAKVIRTIGNRDKAK